MGSKIRPCQQCGAIIPVERVEALSETRLCIACSKEVGSEFDITLTQENLAKSIDVASAFLPMFTVQKDGAINSLSPLPG